MAEQVITTSEIERLPEECMSYVLSRTSPRDSCIAALVSPAFRRAVDSDTTWARFLPSDHREILSSAVESVNFSSSKELYFKLCESILADGGKKIFSLEKESGRKCFTMCARDLCIVWANDERYWRWASHADSRFAEVAELWAVCWLEIGGSIDSRFLSPNTTYKAFLIFKLAPESYGLRFPTQQVSVKLGAQISEGEVCLHPCEGGSGRRSRRRSQRSCREIPLEVRVPCTRNDGSGRRSRRRSQRSCREIPLEVRVPCTRNDSWMEIEMGEFFNEDGEDGNVTFSLRGVKEMNWKRGLIVEGIQVRPK